MPTTATPPGYYTIGEAAAVLGRSHSQVSRYIAHGHLPAFDLGHQKLIASAAVAAFTPPLRGNPNFRKKSKP